MKRIFSIILAGLIFVSTTAIGQTTVDKKVLNWYNGAKFGMSTDLAYKELLASKTSTTVIVGVIDSGVDIEHEDLKGKIWTNTDEIPGNKIDDDKNGYIDDVHGWNFLGNADGENLEHEQLEMTRLYSKYEARFKGKSYTDLNDEEKKEYELYKTVREKVEAERKDATSTLELIMSIYNPASEADTKIKKATGGTYTDADLKKLSKDPELGKDAKYLIELHKLGLTMAVLQDYVDYLNAQLEYHYNIDYNARKIVGDDPDNFKDVGYGNSDVEGPDAMHGTHCSGIIGAIRGNGIGNDGVADNILIMSLRAVPDGDERDKDIALAIRYAVDNGASVVNMSFGKSYSPYQEEVIAAIRYAEEKGVLLVHAAGNDGKDIGEEDNYPSPQYPSMSTKFTNWIEVGASTRYKKALAASFSNYSDKLVDIYAPGLEIYSTVPQSEYEESQGTSMAAPMVTGLAALLKSYFPSLTMFQIKDIILQSGQDVKEMDTPIPGGEETVEFGKLCITGSIANTYNAVKLAEEVSAGK